MYLNTKQPGEVLTEAYGITKKGRREPVADTSSDLRAAQQVVYDAFKKCDRSEILSTPAQLLGAKQTRAGRMSTTGQVMDFIEAGYIIAAAENQGQGYKEWARFAYNPDHDDEWCRAGAAIANRLFCAWAYLNQRSARLSADRYQDMAMLCCIDSAFRYATGKPKFSADEICQHIGYKNKDNANWPRSLRGHWRFMSQILDFHNSKTMTPVKAKIYELRYDETQKTYDAAATASV